MEILKQAVKWLCEKDMILYLKGNLNSGDIYSKNSGKILECNSKFNLVTLLGIKIF